MFSVFCFSSPSPTVSRSTATKKSYVRLEKCHQFCMSLSEELGLYNFPSEKYWVDSSVPQSFLGFWHVRSFFKKQLDVLNHSEVLSLLKWGRTSWLIWLMEFMSHFRSMTLDFMLFKFLRIQKYFPGIMICLYLNLYAAQLRLMWLLGTKQWVMPLVTFSARDSVPSAQNCSLYRVTLACFTEPTSNRVKSVFL